MQTQSISEKMALLVKAAKLLREDFLGLQQQFDGTFMTTSETESLPRSLKDFLRLLIDGPVIGRSKPIQTEHDTKVSAAVLSAGQIIVFNAVKRHRMNDTSRNIHFKNIRRKEKHRYHCTLV